jgi:ABC-type lipoprotein release transport system permease subunit
MVLLAVDGVMLVAGLTACWVPLRRALRIDPTEALRVEA